MTSGAAGRLIRRLFQHQTGLDVTDFEIKDWTWRFSVTAGGRRDGLNRWDHETVNSGQWRSIGLVFPGKRFLASIPGRVGDEGPGAKFFFLCAFGAAAQSHKGSSPRSALTHILPQFSLTRYHRLILLVWTGMKEARQPRPRTERLSRSISEIWPRAINTAACVGLDLRRTDRRTVGRSGSQE